MEKNKFEIESMIQVEKLLMLNYKEMGISDDEVVILLLTYTLIKTGNSFINPADLALLCNFTETKIDVLYTKLISKGLIKTEIHDNGSVSTSIQPLIEKLNEIYVNNFNKKASANEDNKESNEKNVYNLFEQFFGRPLSPLEYDIINGWLEKKYTYDEISRAVDLCKQSPNHSIRYIDTILFEEHKKKEMGDAAYQDDLQETIELSKIDWLNK